MLFVRTVLMDMAVLSKIKARSVHAKGDTIQIRCPPSLGRPPFLPFLKTVCSFSRQALSLAFLKTRSLSFFFNPIFEAYIKSLRN